MTPWLGRRRGLVLTLLLAVAALEHGAHSVHHLGRPETTCVISVVTDSLAAPGTYTARWRVLSVDAHLTQGDFTFHVAP